MIFQKVLDVDDGLGPYDALHRGSGARFDPSSLSEVAFKDLGCVIMGDRFKLPVDDPKQATESRTANARRIVQYLAKNRPQLVWRTRDDLEHLRGRGLLFQR